MANEKYSEKILTELILYVGDKCGLDEHYGVLKLNKILFYSDFLAFKTRGKSITGAEYRKYPHGPAPAVMKGLKQKLAKKGVAFEYRNFLQGLGEDDAKAELRLLPRRAPKMSVFSPEEVAIVDRVIEQLRSKTGHEVSEQSHRHPGWRLASMGETIPYFTAVLSEDAPRPLSAHDLKRARKVAAQFKASSSLAKVA